MSKSSIHRRAAVVRHPGSYAVAGGAGLIGSAIGLVITGFFWFIMATMVVAWWIVKGMFLGAGWVVGKVAPVAAEKARKFYMERLVKRGELTDGDVRDLAAIRAARPVTHWVPGDREKNLHRFQ